jgi:hypothetical protein
MPVYEKSEAKVIVVFDHFAKNFVNVIPEKEGSAIVLVDYKLEVGRFIRINTGDSLEVVEGGTVVVAKHDPANLDRLGFLQK